MTIEGLVHIPKMVWTLLSLTRIKAEKGLSQVSRREKWPWWYWRNSLQWRKYPWTINLVILQSSSTFYLRKCFQNIDFSLIKWQSYIHSPLKSLLLFMRRRWKSEKAPLTDFQSDTQIAHFTTAWAIERQSQEEIQWCRMPPVSWIITEDKEGNGCDNLKT